MEGDVGLDVSGAVRVRHRGLHGRQCLVQDSYLVGAGPVGGEPGRFGLDDPAQFARVTQQSRGVLGLFPAQYVRVEVVPVLRAQDACAGARTYVQHPLGHQRLDRLPQEAAADADLGRERVLDRQRGSGLPRPAHDASPELVDHPLVRGREMRHDLRSPPGRHSSNHLMIEFQTTTRGTSPTTAPAP